MNPDVWTNRFTVRKFSETNREINPEHLVYLETVLNNLPLQCNTKSDIWIYLDDSDKEIREWLVKEVFWMNGPEGREHMLPVIQAPGIFLCATTPNKAWLMSDQESQKTINELAIRHEGMTCGVLLSELLRLDYNVGTFRCNAGLEENNEDKRDYFTNYMNTTYKEQLEVMFGSDQDGQTDNVIFEPGIAVCFGPEAEEHFNIKTGMVYKESKEQGQRDTWNSIDYARWKIQGRKIYDIPKCIVKK